MDKFGDLLRVICFVIGVGVVGILVGLLMVWCGNPRPDWEDED